MARKILLADDSVTAQNMGRKILADAGYEVITVNNGSAALKKIGEQHPDVIVLDVYMPGYSGLEVCQRLKEGGETARIPILLTVGKLEPFKPEEAKRVRADAFIVKPFEASELLSALTKLEDKIVHHAESSKPGRFGRATAAVDTAYDKTMAIKEDEGWKNRISFPHQKNEIGEQEEPVGSDPAKPQPAAAPVPMPVSDVKQTEQEKVDLGALAPTGFPKDVTPEEIAALAAAAARIKGKFAEEKTPELPVIPPEAGEERTQEPPAASAPLPTVRSMAGPGPLYVPEQKVEAKQSKPVREFAPLEPPEREAKPAEIKAEEKPREVPAPTPRSLESAPSAEEPVTMAVAPVTESSSARWTAVAVALAPEDSAVSLEQEMQKAFAASAGVESSTTISVPSGAAAGTAFSPSAPAPARESATPLPISEPKPAVASEPVTAAATEFERAATSLVASASATQTATPETSIASEVAQVVPADVWENAVKSEPVKSEPVKSEPVNPEPAKIEPAKLEPANIEQIERRKAEEPVVAETRSSGAAIENAAPAIEDVERFSEVAAHHPSSHEHSEVPPESRVQTPDLSVVAKAALASWKPEHSSEGNGSSGDSSKHDGVPNHGGTTAVELGAKTPDDKAKLEDEADPDVASIVDSVLANLRPKIVQEISRKLGKK